jgi:hypothetical protein
VGGKFLRGNTLEIIATGWVRAEGWVESFKGEIHWKLLRPDGSGLKGGWKVSRGKYTGNYRDRVGQG